MSRFSVLRATLVRLVLISLPAVAVGCGDDASDPCVEQRELIVEVSEPPPPDLEALVRACEANAEDCIDLCSRILMDAASWATVGQCDVTHDADHHDVRVGYAADTGAAGCPVPGRRPSGLTDCSAPKAADPAGQWLAQAAWFEAASVHAFVALARELGVYGAPPRLQRAALRAAADEVRHTRAMSSLAQARGVHPAELPKVAPPRPRSLEEMAVENATEGCVGETWAALLAHWQAHQAMDNDVRAAAAAIAEDETRHATLAWQVDRWARSRLDPPAQRRVAAARRRAVDRLEASTRIAEPHPALRRLGVPDGPTLRQLFERSRQAVWT